MLLSDISSQSLVVSSIAGTKIEADEFLQEAKTLIDNYDFWQHQVEGLACFLTQNETRYYRLPESFIPIIDI